MLYTPGAVDKVTPRKPGILKGEQNQGLFIYKPLSRTQSWLSWTWRKGSRHLTFTSIPHRWWIKWQQPQFCTCFREAGRSLSSVRLLLIMLWRSSSVCDAMTILVGKLSNRAKYFLISVIDSNRLICQGHQIAVRTVRITGTVQYYQ